MGRILKSALFTVGVACIVLAAIGFAGGSAKAWIASPRTLVLVAIALLCGLALRRGDRVARPRDVFLDLPSDPWPPPDPRAVDRPAPPPAFAGPIDFSLLDDSRDAAAYVAETRGRLRPVSVLNAVRVQITRGSAARPGGPYDEPIGIAHTRGIGATSAHEAAMNALADIRRKLFDTDPVLRTALARLVAAGVRPIWTSDATYAVQGRILRLEVPHEALARLQDMAADDAGLKTPEERREAAEIHHRWLLQNYHREWKAYQSRWPTLYANPY